MEYRVTWVIDLDAESFEDAARLVRQIQLEPDSLATHFIVRGRHGDDLEYGPIRSIRADCAAKGIVMEIYVCVPIEEGIVRDVRAFMTESSAQQAEAAWLARHEPTEEKLREVASN